MGFIRWRLAERFLKVLITDIHHGNGGGHVTYVLSLLREMAGRCQFTLAAPETGRLFREASRLSHVRVLPGLYTSRVFSAIPEIRNLRRFLKTERFDIAHCNGGADHRHVMLASLGLREAPAIVWTKHNTNKVDSFGHRMRARFGTQSAIAVCEFVEQQLQQSGYARAPIAVVRNGIDTTYLQPASATQRQEARQAFFGDLPDNALVFGSIGGTDLNKGWLLLVEAVSLLPPELRSRVRLLVAGDPPNQDMMARVRELNMQDSVHFPGLVADVRRVLAASDVGFVLSYREAASYASCETMAAGLPTLVSAAGGLPENVRDGQDGWVVPVGDVPALHAYLQQLLAGRFCLETLGRNARSRVEQEFSLSKFAADTEIVYRRARAYRQGHRRVVSAPL